MVKRESPPGSGPDGKAQAVMRISVCAPNDECPPGTLKLCVASFAMVMNPPGWKHLWCLSPLSTVDGGISVPGLHGVRSLTVENAWQFLKIWPEETGWLEEEAMEAFRSTCGIRFPRGRGKRSTGFHWGVDGRVLPYLEARRRVYAASYVQMLALPDRARVIAQIREESIRRPVVVWDPDSYDVTRCGMKHYVEAVDYEPRPFAHAFVVAAAVEGRLEEFS